MLQLTAPLLVLITPIAAISITATTSGHPSAQGHSAYLEPPPCGSCDAEQLSLKDVASAPTHLNWTSPAQMDAWERRQFNVQSPDLFQSEYKGTRKWCDGDGRSTSRWSQPKRLIEHTLEHMRAQYGFPCAREGGFCRCMGRVFLGQLEGVSTLSMLLRRNHSYKDVPSPQWGTCCGTCGGMSDPSPSISKQCFCSVDSPRGFAYEAAWMRPNILRQPSKPLASVCVAPATTDAWGRTEQLYITRVGPLSTEPAAYYHRGEKSDIQLALIPALPKTGTVYITVATLKATLHLPCTMHAARPPPHVCVATAAAGTRPPPPHTPTTGHANTAHSRRHCYATLHAHRLPIVAP